MFEHWLPYERYSSEEQAQLAEPYFFEEISYEQLGWEVSANEGEGHRHLAFELVACLCEMREWITSFVERQRHKLEAWLWEREEPDLAGSCPNAYKARTTEKQAALNQVREALVKLKKLSGGKQENLITLLHRAGLRLRTPSSVLIGSKAVRLCHPHNWGYALF